LQNLANASPSDNLPPMLSARLLPFLQQLTNSKKWSDEEIKADVEALKEQLQETKKTLTCASFLLPCSCRERRTFDEYEQELESGFLTWDTPTHADDDFWRLNAAKLLEKDRRGVKCVRPSFGREV
jgi:V-type H+-transporting ATPase subunit H